MKPRYRLLACDIDGTVTDGNGEVRPRVRQALRDAVAQGLVVTLVTGRGRLTTRQVAEALGSDVAVILNNGSMVCDGIDGEPIEQRLLPRAVALEAIDACRAAGLEPVVADHPERSERLLIERVAELPQHFVERNRYRIDQVPCVATAVDRDVLVIFLLGDQVRIQRLTGELTARFGQRAAIQPLWHPLYQCWTLDVLPPGSGKWEALRRFAGRRGITPEQIVAVGDGLNDIGMIQGAGLGVAMGNADREVLAAADLIVADVDHDGVAELIEQHLWVARHEAAAE